jgi:hypothetical protein
MNPVQKTVSETLGSGSEVCLTVIASDPKLMAADPEQLMEDMWVRATKIGPVLEDIIQEPHPETIWD